MIATKNTEEETTDRKETNARALTAQAFANRYSLSLRFVRELCAEGILPQIKLGSRCVRIPLEEADAALMAYKTGGAE